MASRLTTLLVAGFVLATAAADPRREAAGPEARAPTTRVLENLWERLSRD